MLQAPRPAAPNGGPGLATRTEQDGAHDRFYIYQKTVGLAAWSGLHETSGMTSP
jgi:hypothetical protein